MGWAQRTQLEHNPCSRRWCGLRGAQVNTDPACPPWMSRHSGTFLGAGRQGLQTPHLAKWFVVLPGEGRALNSSLYGGGERGEGQASLLSEAGRCSGFPSLTSLLCQGRRCITPHHPGVLGWSCHLQSDLMLTAALQQSSCPASPQPRMDGVGVGGALLPLRHLRARKRERLGLLCHGADRASR